MVEALLFNGQAKVDYIDVKNGMTPLMYALDQKSPEIVAMLLREGASRELCDFKCTTPLMAAARTGNTALCKAIGGEFTRTIDMQDENGWTALHWAVYADAPNVIAYLLDVCVANRNLRCYKKKKPYHLAVFMQYGDCEAILIDRKIEMAIAAGEGHLH